VTDLTIARQRFGTHIPDITQSTVEGPPLLGSNSLGTFRSNGHNTVIHGLFEVVVSLRFAASYKREFNREFRAAVVREFGRCMFS
jgi:hypothetical protein